MASRSGRRGGVAPHHLCLLDRQMIWLRPMLTHCFRGRSRIGIAREAHPGDVEPDRELLIGRSVQMLEADRITEVLGAAVECFLFHVFSEESVAKCTPTLRRLEF